MTIKELQAELKALQEKRQTESQVKQLKKQIKAEKFGQTKSGKVFNKIADVGDAGAKWLFTGKPQPAGSKKKKKKVPTVEEIMERLPQ